MKGPRIIKNIVRADFHAHTVSSRDGLIDVPRFIAATLRASLAQAVVFGRLSPWWVHLFSNYAKWRKRLAGK